MLKQALIKNWHRMGCFITLASISLSVRADNLPPVKGAADWIMNTMIAVAVSVIGIKIVYSLWQVSEGQKEPKELAKPILITAAMVSVPTLLTAIISSYAGK